MAVKKVTLSQEDERSGDRYRNQFVRLVAEQDQNIQGLSGEAATELERQVIKKDADDSKVMSAAKVIIGGLSTELVRTMLSKNEQAAEVLKNKETSFLASTFNNPDYNRYIKQKTGNFVQNEVKKLVGRKWPGTQITLGTRITTIQGSSLKTVQDILRTGVNEGYSAKVIAKEINNFIRPTEGQTWTSPFTWYRDAYGYKQSKNVTARMAGSYNSNAIRIARTEINQTWRLGTLDFHGDEPWIAGYNWVLSGSHPEEDICDEWADDSPYETAAEVADLGHPYCMCHIEPIPREVGGDDYFDDEEWEGSDLYLDDCLDEFKRCLG